MSPPRCCHWVFFHQSFLFEIAKEQSNSMFVVSLYRMDLLDFFMREQNVATSLKIDITADFPEY